MPYLTRALMSTVCPRRLSNPKCLAFYTLGLVLQEANANSKKFLKNSFLVLYARWNFFTFQIFF